MSNSSKSAAKIRAATNPPLQRLRVSVSSWPGFGIVLRSRRNSLFPISCSVLVANARRTSFQGHRPPIAVASPSRPRFVADSCLGEFALSSRASQCFYLALYRFLASAWPTPAKVGHGAAVSCSTLAGRFLSPPPPRSNLGPWFAIQRPSSKDTPSAGCFAENPLRFLKYKPAVRLRFRCLRFLSSETYFQPRRSETAFPDLQFCR